MAAGLIRSRPLLAGFVLACVWAAGSQPAGADVAYPSEVTIAFNEKSPKGFAGFVESERRQCTTRRRVTVFMKRPGADPEIGSFRSEPPSGFWLVKPEDDPAKGETFYARAKAKTVERNDGEDWLCKQGRSEDFTPVS